MKNTKKKILNVLLFILVIFLTFYFVLRNNDMNKIMSNILSVDIKYILIGFFIMFLFVFCEGLNLYRVLKRLNHNVSIMDTIKYALVGFFFSSITPSSSGGQPLQLYFMNKDKLPISDCLIALIIQLFSFQVTCSILAIIGVILNFHKLIGMGNLKYLLLVGFVVNIIIVTSLFVILFSNKLAIKVLNFINKILNKLHFKKVQSFYERALDEMKHYQKSALFLTEHRGIIYRTFLISFIQLFFYQSIPYFVYKSFGFCTYSIFDFVFMQALLYVGVAFLPFPGAMGVSEGSFVTLFKMFFPTSILSSAMLISRGISFYLFVIIAGVLLLIFTLFSKYKKKDES
ncbi:MAG: flippase-like domain-containing protein [Bacilli bacterium]|nr:flippase-like domain-containing protein [Bacilli bacterium]